MEATDLKSDLEERSHLKRVSRAYSERSAVVPASTTTTQPPTSTTPPSLPHPETTVRSKATVSTTTTEATTTTTEAPIVTEAPPSEPEAPAEEQEEVQPKPDNYQICYNAAASRKGNKIAPNVARWTDLVTKYFPGEVSKTCGVMACESSGNPNATGPRQPNGSYPKGLMQILNGPYDPEANLKLAASMRASRGWQPWSQCL